MTRKPILESREHDIQRDPGYELFCAGYERKEWRGKQLVNDVVGAHLIEFCFGPEATRVDSSNAMINLKEAAKIFYTTNNYGRRGELGELLLHSILRDFYRSECAVSKIMFKDSPNDTVKGADAVHVVMADDGELDLWLGEAKLYKNAKEAIKSAIQSIGQFEEDEYLRSEFLAVTNKLEPNWPYSDQLSRLLDRNTSLDVIANRLVIPILIVYDSKMIQKHQSVDDFFIEQIQHEGEDLRAYFEQQLPTSREYRLRLILLPAKSVDRLRECANELLVTIRTLGD